MHIHIHMHMRMHIHMRMHMHMQVPLVDLKIGGRSIGMRRSEYPRTIIDSGTTFMYLPTEVIIHTHTHIHPHMYLPTEVIIHTHTCTYLPR